VCFQVLTGDNVDPVFATRALELLEFSVLSLGAKFASFLPDFVPKVFAVFSALDAAEAFDGYMLHHLSVLRVFFACLHGNASHTLQFLNDRAFTSVFYKLWRKHSDDFQSVYGCKLQVLAALAVIARSD
ncbi:nuclear transport factor, partial [Metschnikowia bicuspidata]